MKELHYRIHPVVIAMRPQTSCFRSSGFLKSDTCCRYVSISSRISAWVHTTLKQAQHHTGQHNIQL